MPKGILDDLDGYVTSLSGNGVEKSEINVSLSVSSSHRKAWTRLGGRWKKMKINQLRAADYMQIRILEMFSVVNPN